MIRIGYLLPELMNAHGDRGNVLALVRRCRWRGLGVEVEELGPGDPVPAGRFDIFFMGGGQGRQQSLAGRDLVEVKGEAIRREIDGGAGALLICGGYQLFGRFFRPLDGEDLPGIAIFDACTLEGEKRFVGNVVARSGLGGASGLLVGFENHSGRTYLGDGCAPLGTVTVGRGNNGEDRTEGAIYKGAIGTYLHGSLLPKNQALADFLIERALTRRGFNAPMKPLDDTIEEKAHAAAVARARA